MIDDTLLDAEERMDKALSVAREDLGSVRTGRAAPSMFNKVLVDYYGTPTPVPQMSSITGLSSWCSGALRRGCGLRAGGGAQAGSLISVPILSPATARAMLP